MMLGYRDGKNRSQVKVFERFYGRNKDEVQGNSSIPSLIQFHDEEILTEEKLAKHCSCEHICSLEILLLILCPAVDVQYPSPGTTTSLNLATESLATVDSFAKKNSYNNAIMMSLRGIKCSFETKFPCRVLVEYNQNLIRV